MNISSHNFSSHCRTMALLMMYEDVTSKTLQTITSVGAFSSRATSTPSKRFDLQISVISIFVDVTSIVHIFKFNIFKLKAVTQIGGLANLRTCNTPVGTHVGSLQQHSKNSLTCQSELTLMMLGDTYNPSLECHVTLKLTKHGCSGMFAWKTENKGRTTPFE